MVHIQKKNTNSLFSYAVAVVWYMYVQDMQNLVNKGYVIL